MEKIMWEVKYLSTPSVLRYCKKCNRITEYICTCLFRVNAQRKCLDIWLIYKCSNCNTTWNLTIYSRINPKSLSSKVLEQFHKNDISLANQYAMDFELIRKNGAEVGLPNYEILGAENSFNTPIELCIRSEIPSQIKVSKILREKLSLSNKDFENMVSSGEIKSKSGLDLKKCKLNKEINLFLEKL